MFGRLSRFVCLPVASLALVTALLGELMCSEAHAQYRTYRDALSAGASALRARQYEDARAPLEYALKAAGDDQSRLRAHALLTEVYFHAGQTEKVINSLDFILTHSSSEPERRLSAEQWSIMSEIKASLKK